MPTFIQGNLVLQDMAEASPSLQEYGSSNGVVVQDTGVLGSHYAMAQLSDGRIVYCSTRESSSNIGIRILNADGSDGGTLTDPLDTLDLPWWHVRNISVDLSDNIYIIGATGASGGQTDFDPTGVEGDKIFIRKFDSNGVFVEHMDFACNKGRGNQIKQGTPLPCTLISPCDSTEDIVESVCTADTIGFIEHTGLLAEGAVINREGTIAYFLMNRFIYKCVFGESAATIFKDFAEQVLLNPLGDEVVDTSYSPSGGLAIDSSENVIVNMYHVSTRNWEHRLFQVLELETAQETILSGNSYTVEFNSVENYMNMPLPSVPATAIGGVDDPSIPDKGWGISASARVAGITEVSIEITGAPLGANNPKVVTLTGPAQTVTALAQVVTATATGMTVTNNGPGTLTLGSISSGSACSSGSLNKELGIMSHVNNGPQTWSYWTLDQETYDSNGNLVSTRNIMTWPEEDLTWFGRPWVTTMRWEAINGNDEVFYFLVNGIPFYSGAAIEGHVELRRDITQIKEKFLDFWEITMPPLIVTTAGGVVFPGIARVPKLGTTQDLFVRTSI